MMPFPGTADLLARLRAPEIPEEKVRRLRELEAAAMIDTLMFQLQSRIEAAFDKAKAP